MRKLLQVDSMTNKIFFQYTIIGNRILTNQQLHIEICAVPTTHNVKVSKGKNLTTLKFFKSFVIKDQVILYMYKHTLTIMFHYIIYNKLSRPLFQACWPAWLRCVKHLPLPPPIKQKEKTTFQWQHKI